MLWKSTLPTIFPVEFQVSLSLLPGLSPKQDQLACTQQVLIQYVLDKQKKE